MSPASVCGEGEQARSKGVACPGGIFNVKVADGARVVRKGEELWAAFSFGYLHDGT